MFNKKLKERIKTLESDLAVLEERQQRQLEIIGSLNEVISAQAIILESFSGYIVKMDKTKKKGKKNVKTK